jgi:uncharacterized protein YigA (DUF484 family)
MSKVDSSTIITKDESIDAASVAGYLRQHPDFFNEHSALLADIKLTHDCGPATSLIERQTQVMRHKILDYAARMSDILTTARRNDVQFEKTKRLVLELITATHLNALTEALKESFTGEFHADAVHLALFSSLKTADNHPNLSSAKSLDESANFAETQKLANKNWAYFQAFKGPAMVHLFPDHNKLQSSAVVPLYLADKALGVLIIASNNANHYNDQLDTLFLNHVAAVISRCLGRIQA